MRLHSMNLSDISNVPKTDKSHLLIGQFILGKIRVDPYNTGRPVNYTSTRKNTGRPVFLKYGSTRIFTGRPVYLRVDPYNTGRPVNASRPVKYGSTRKYKGRPAKIRVDPYYTGGPVKIRVDPYIYGSTRKNTGGPVSEIRVDP